VKSSLLRALRMVISADSDPARQALFSNLRQSRWTVRLAYGVHERLGGTWTSALLVSGYGVAAFLFVAPPRNRDARILVIAKHANARRQVSRVAAWVGSAQCGWVSTGIRSVFDPSVPAALVSLLASGRLLTLVRRIRAIDRRHGFLVSCRAAAALGYYARALAMLEARRPGALLVSSDSHPEEDGFVAAARTLRIPQVFISHAYPTPFTPPLDFDLSILEGEAAVEARRRKGPVKGAVLLAGLEGNSAPLDVSRFERPSPVIGIFPPKAIRWETLAAIVRDCREHYGARQIVIRWHPSMLATPHLEQVLTDRSDIVESDRQASLPEVAARCDWVVADENSNVHLPVLKLGIPTVAVKGLGLYPPSRSDLYGFAASGIVFPPVASIREVNAEALRAFFADCWPSRFERYDASYLRSPGEVGQQVTHAISRLVAGASPERADA
jgi:hypothetical protein